MNWCLLPLMLYKRPGFKIRSKSEQVIIGFVHDTSQEHSSSWHQWSIALYALITHLCLTSTMQRAHPYSCIHFHFHLPPLWLISIIYVLVTLSLSLFLLPRKYRPAPIFHTDEIIRFGVSDYIQMFKCIQMWEHE